jgi:hypothetical protein
MEGTDTKEIVETEGNYVPHINAHDGSYYTTILYIFCWRLHIIVVLIELKQNETRHQWFVYLSKHIEYYWLL